MDKLIYAAFRAVHSLFTYSMLKLFIKSIIVTLIALFGFIFLSGVFFDWLAHMLHAHAIAHFLPWLGSIGASIIAWMLFPGIMPLIISFFDETIALLIEKQDYPYAMPGAAQPFWPNLWHDLRFSLKAIGLNILVLPLYLVPMLNLCLFYVLNGYLLGHEFFCMVARRHLSLTETDALYQSSRSLIIAAGVLLALMATLPFFNLFAPFWGIATMVHLYHRLQSSPKQELIMPGNHLN